MTQQGYRNVSIKYDVQLNISSLSTVFEDKYAYMYNYGKDYGYQIFFDYNLQELNTIQQQIDMLNYDRVEYRLTGQSIDDTTKFKSNNSISVSMGRFNSSIKSVKFSCLNMLGAQQATCKKMLYINMNTYYSSPVYNLDIMFYFQNQLQFLMKANRCLARYTCWNYGVVVLTPSGVQLQLTRNNECDNYHIFYDYSNISTRFIVENENPNQIQIYQRFENIRNATNVNKFFYNCDEVNCSQISTHSTFTFEYDCATFVEKFIFMKVENKRKKSIGKISGISTGCGILIIILTVLYKKTTYSRDVINKYQVVKVQKKPTKDQILLQELTLMIENDKFKQISG
ncbi:Hypothetical_protein [Hexamita inflata]|uniref:Hypothetical_protein n=1 Tax=Hexamita inflata TaxID=28002 RepID=A0AA86UCT9_9EUKA|nr:Hypothetical protein HINF_LOCUS33647 [Hexamita inflata]